MKFLFVGFLLFFSLNAFAGKDESLKITEVGAWAEGNSIFYVRFDREVGPSECRSAFTKTYLSQEDSSPKEIEAMNTIKAMALMAMAANMSVSIYYNDGLAGCSHNHPTIRQLFVQR